MKKILALLMAVCMMLALLTGCGSAPAETPQTPAEQPVAEKPAEKETVALKVWADQVELELTEKLCNDFAAAHPEKEYVFEFGAVGAVDGKSRYLEDPAAAADVFVFADDQLIDLVKADALYEVTRNTDAIVAANTAGSINAASYDGVLYGYPMTSDNGYFLYYDKSVFTEEDLKTLDGILAAANAAGKQVQMGSFLGCKIYGVNSQTAYPVDAMELAEFLTSEQSQLERYEALNYGPSNVAALASDAVASNLALRALAEQSNYAVTQLVLGGFWVPAEAFGAELEAHTTADLQTLLDQLVEQATAA